MIHNTKCIIKRDAAHTHYAILSMSKVYNQQNKINIKLLVTILTTINEKGTFATQFSRLKITSKRKAF